MGLALGPAYEPRCAALGKRDLDRVEIARGLGAREDGARLVADLASPVAAGDVRHSEQPRLRLPRKLRRLSCRAVRGLARPLGLLLGEGGLVHEHVGHVRRDGQALAWRGVTGDHHLASLARRSHDLLGRDAGNALAVLQQAEVRPRAHAQAFGRARVELARPRRLHERVAVGDAFAMVDGERGHLVAVALHRLALVELGDRQLEGQTTIDDAHHAHQLPQAARPVHGQRRAALAQRERLEHPRQPQPVVSVEMRDEHAVYLDESDRAQQLALRAFAAVEQQAIAPALHQHRGQPAPGRRHRAPGAGKEH